MSRGGRTGHGIGYSFYSKYFQDIFSSDFCVIRNGVKVKVPRYFSNLYSVDFPDEYAKIKIQRLNAAYDRKEDNTSKRLLDKEKIQLSKLQLLPRDI